MAARPPGAALLGKPSANAGWWTRLLVALFVASIVALLSLGWSDSARNGAPGAQVCVFIFSRALLRLQRVCDTRARCRIACLGL